jgi:hypothetical protein
MFAIVFAILEIKCHRKKTKIKKRNKETKFHRKHWFLREAAESALLESCNLKQSARNKIK